jgi:hypothetical protein
MGCASSRVHITTPEGRVYDVGATAILWEKDHVIIPAITPTENNWTEWGFGSGLDLRVTAEPEKVWNPWAGQE